MQILHVSNIFIAETVSGLQVYMPMLCHHCGHVTNYQLRMTTALTTPTSHTRQGVVNSMPG